MPINKLQFAQLIRDFNFKELFNELGWDRVVKVESIRISEQQFLLTAVAQKKGFVVFQCHGSDGTRFPEKNIRKSIDRIISKLYFEHLIIYTDPDQTRQIWQIAIKQDGRPISLAETTFYSNQEPEILLQKLDGLFFSIDQEDNISIVDVKTAVIKQFSANSSKVTKKFYNEFKTHHKAFLDFIQGISDKAHQDWYASLMLNRLMFIYFIQKRGFLNEDLDYLRNKLQSCQENKGKNKFYKGFYKDFLRVLFHQGLGAPKHTPELLAEIGRVPYLNGGLFDVHEIEKNPAYDIFIGDAAFERIFDFFDQYEWHLDTSISASGKDINPDVIGYIFEKYINDRSSMGAYYTQEDITDYISKNCIIPYIFDELKRKYPAALKSDGPAWSMVKSSHDRYIYDSVKKGVLLDLPGEIEAGTDTAVPGLLERRKEWNKTAPEAYALPTEIWREVIDRRNRYQEITGKIKNGDIYEINDFITYNLNIRQFALDILQKADDHDLIRHFYKAISTVTILDPTCGSGAFLFAAMNILYPLYDTCISRMEQFVANGTQGQYKFFEEELAKINSPKHPNTDYFIYKSIILNNLYGVDIMNEAVEIAKLRLFLKLVATVDIDYSKENMGLEPLPDIDFNIRCGNTLVGFATENELDYALSYTLDFDNAKETIIEKMEIVSKAFKHFKRIQLTQADDYLSFKTAKEDLNNRLRELNDKLNKYLSNEYSINHAIKGEYIKWVKSHQPFHWFSEFYEIINNDGGFNIIIGNPPYVEYSKVRKDYLVPKKLNTISCGNLYPYVIEIANKILFQNGHQGFILPLSAFCTQRMEPLVKIYKKLNNDSWISHFGWRPATLFEGVNIPLSIVISRPNLERRNSSIYITEYNKWYREKRSNIFDLIHYNYGNHLLLHDFVFPKIDDQYSSIFKKILSTKSRINHYVGYNTNNLLFYRNTGGLYWRIILNFKPFFKSNVKEASSSTLNTICFKDSDSLLISVALLNSNLFWLFYVAYSSFYHVNPIDVLSFPVNFEEMSEDIRGSLKKLAVQLMEEMNSLSKIETRIHKGGNTSQSQAFYPSLTKSTVDKIDHEIAKYYGFSEDELDAIINYDIVFRLQNEIENGNENC